MTDDSKIRISKVAPFGLRLLPKLKRDLDAVAEANGRSLNAEITERLEWSLAAEKDFARYRAATDAHSKLAAQRVLSANLSDQTDPIVNRLKVLENEIAAIKAHLRMGEPEA